jgi:hypothetical protein
VCLNGAVCSQGLCVGGTTQPDTTGNVDPQCLPGQVLQYGECVYPSPGSAPGGSNSGCQETRHAQGIPWSLVFAVLGLVIIRRRSILEP